MRYSSHPLVDVLRLVERGREHQDPICGVQL